MQRGASRYIDAMDATDNAARTSLREVYLGRQPILDKSQALAGYELLFRTAVDQGDAGSDPRAATADVVCKAFAELGLPNVLGPVRAFINVDETFLADDVVELLPKDMVVFEVDAAILNSLAVVIRCQHLKEIGYQFAISGLTQVDDVLRPLLELATYLKVNVSLLPPDELQNVAGELRTTRRKLVACRVESQTQMELCSLLGFSMFQGYYFAKPDIIEGRTLDASTQGIFRLMQLLNSDAEVDELEQVFRTEPALVVNLLRLTNSVGVGLRVKVSSVRHAINVIGRRQLQRWLQLLVFSHGKQVDLKHNPLMQYAALRGCFMELLVDSVHRERRELRDPAFITGLMSVMPAALGLSMTDILTQITVDNDVRLALSRREGTLGQMLIILEQYDDNNLTELQASLQHFGGSVTVGLLVEILAESLEWVRQLDNHNE